MTIKTLLKEIRKEEGLKQIEVAEKAQIPIRNYQYYEAGKRIPNVYTAQLIAKVLGTSVEKLFPLNKEIEKKSDSNPTEN